MYVALQCCHPLNKSTWLQYLGAFNNSAVLSLLGGGFGLTASSCWSIWDDRRPSWHNRHISVRSMTALSCYTWPRAFPWSACREFQRWAWITNLELADCALLQVNWKAQIEHVFHQLHCVTPWNLKFVFLLYENQIIQTRKDLFFFMHCSCHTFE